MGMSGAYAPSEENEGIASIRKAIEGGMTLIDAGDFYGNGHNESARSARHRGTVRQGATLHNPARGEGAPYRRAANRIRYPSRAGPENAIFARLAELGNERTLYGVLSRVLLTGSKVTGARALPALQR